MRKEPNYSYHLVTAQRVGGEREVVKQRARYARVRGDAGVKNPAAPRVKQKCSPSDYGQYVILDNTRLCAWFMCLLRYTCSVILECTLSTSEKVAVSPCAVSRG